ncbi:putative small nucleolar ribonucleo protein complex subunit [Xylona heveae TC161]|uniref:Putative small nucleolar ribonucleo protein complex subunit n=1 Tax=Xylona heveae (strain CBS 132557 / TC161) TaxID=1328760 RepID=A0A165AEU1_XYLHT|nr:putative small nucleolar ribonucleo protein complex subunit [Xylona heveae TC161]KZF20360.1 putative small nucleolar ribonucleo protein complex subunit [Xylona heveae TC161]
MKTEFKFSNLLGTVYCRGNLLFTPDGTCLLSPVGNRVTVFDLVNNKSYTLPFAHRRNITRIALTPRGNLLLTIDEDGRAILSNFQRRVALHHFSFRAPVSALAFAPSGRHFAVGVERHVEVWHTPSTPDTNAEGELEFAPFVRHRVYAGHYDNVQSIEWSSDSRFFLSSSKDLTARIWSLDPEVGFEPTTLAGHREAVHGAWFSKDQETIWTISRDGALFQWAYTRKPGAPEPEEDEMEDDANMNWRITQKHYFLQNNAKLTCAAFHPETNLLVAGFSNGIFTLYELPEFNMIHTLSISQNDIDFVTLNKTGEWLAFGASKLGQLLVWEWQSESYILKQQGHFDAMNAIAYSPDGQRVITAADDGKIKVWDVNSGFCIVTFTEHTSGVTACEFAKRGNILFTASLDGSVRAWDLIRYRNFRTFTAPTRLAFSSLAVDPSGEVVCAGSLDDFDIHVWSVQTGQLLDQLAGHEGPVSSLAFTADGGSLVSGSWDHTVRVWSIFGRTQTSEPLILQADVLCVAVRPDSLQVAVSTLDGQLTFWSIGEAVQQGGVDGRRDISGGRKISDRRTAANAAGTKSFNTIVYSADGSCVLASGNSKYICLYSVTTGSLLKKYTVSINLSLDGTQEFLNSKLLGEAGPAGLIDTQGEASDLEDRIDRTMPGANRGDLAARKQRPEVRVPAVSFSPTGRAFCAASTEGLLIYSLDTTTQFDPFDLDIDITPATTLATLHEEKNYLKALVMAFRLNTAGLIQRVYEAIPVDDIPHVVDDLPTTYLPRLLRFVAHNTANSPHLEFNLLWNAALLGRRGRWLKDNAAMCAPELRVVQKAISSIRTELMRVAEENVYTIDYLLAQPKASDVSNKLDLLTSTAHDDSNAASVDGDDDESMEEEDGWIGLED